jgi:hypothetical protein
MVSNMVRTNLSDKKEHNPILERFLADPPNGVNSKDLD